MNILGISYGHNATVALVMNGKLIFCQSEERLNRIKNSTGFPKKTLSYVYKQICPPEKIDKVVIFQKSNRGYLHEKKNNFKSFQYGFYLSSDQSFSGVWKNSWLRWYLAQFYFRKILENNWILTKQKRNYYSKSSNQPQNKILYLDHHSSHIYSVFGGVGDWGKALIFTLDAQGDYKCATVSIKNKSTLKIIYSCDYSYSLGNFYANATSLLGMKQGEHEFKVMGLAPYSNKKYYRPILLKLEKLIYLNSRGEFLTSIPPNAVMNRLYRIFRNQRFDNIAGAIQELTENLVINWVKYWSKKINCSNIALSGGVFMNVKLCQKISEENFIKKFYVMPSAADESTAIGAAYWGSLTFDKKNNIQPLTDLYLGVNYNNQEINLIVNKLKLDKNLKVSRPSDINQKVAKILSSGEIVARFSGPMEFGARALGNRSILADPSKFSAIEKINSSIKIRDFWMPFTPSILEEDMERYIDNPKSIFAPYMSLTFNSTSIGQHDLAAAIHPRDKTVRPQCVKKEWNLEYYDLINKFKKITGIGAILNTSFNLHGEPNVCTPQDAISTLKRSDLKYLILNQYLISKF